MRWLEGTKRQHAAQALALRASVPQSKEKPIPTT